MLYCRGKYKIGALLVEFLAQHTASRFRWMGVASDNVRWRDRDLGHFGIHFEGETQSESSAKEEPTGFVTLSQLSQVVFGTLGECFDTPCIFLFSVEYGILESVTL